MQVLFYFRANMPSSGDNSFSRKYTPLSYFLYLLNVQDFLTRFQTYSRKCIINLNCQVASKNREPRIKGKEMMLVWHEKASRTALQTSSVLHTHTFDTDTQTKTTVNEIAEQCRQL